MSAYLLALLVAALSGVAMAFQGSINSALGKAMGLWEATFVVHVTGLAFVSALLFGFRIGDGSLAKVFDGSSVNLLGGVIGVLIVYMVARSIPKVGAAPATTAIIIGQVLTAALVDHLGLFGLQKIPFNSLRLVGVGLLALGGWFLLRR